MPLDLLLDELTAVTRACATAFLPRPLRGVDAGMTRTDQTGGGWLDEATQEQRERAAAGDCGRAIATLRRLVEDRSAQVRQQCSEPKTRRIVGGALRGPGLSARRDARALPRV
eukprot:1355416-Prymnesium_polylepis.1